MSLLHELIERGLVNQITDEEGLEKNLNENKITLYCGFDPTADSLHVGHLVPLLMLRRFQNEGHRPVALVGGGTGLIGDPSFRNEERQLNDESVVKDWSDQLKNQISKFIDFDREENPAQIVNNYEWLSTMSAIELLRDVGKHFSVNYMLAKESVEARIEHGISFTEFSYILLQSLDFLRLYQNRSEERRVGKEW